MLLLVFRHGIAQDLSPDGDDDSRALTELGISRTRLAARGLARIAGRPDRIVTSPRKRAAQTAAILGRLFNRDVTTMNELAGPDVARLAARLLRGPGECVLVVGHQPDLGRLISLLCTGNADAAEIQLKKAGCACVRVKEHARKGHGAGTLVWLAGPRMLRHLARG